MNKNSLMIGIGCLAIGAALGSAFTTNRVKAAATQGRCSLYFTDFQVVDADDGKPVIRSGMSSPAQSNGYYSEAENGHWRVMWCGPPGADRTIVLSADGYETTHLPTAMIQELKAGQVVGVGGIVGPETIKMKRAQHAAPSDDDKPAN
jgi:hypothetical protein